LISFGESLVVPPLKSALSLQLYVQEQIEIVSGKEVIVRTFKLI
jgi:hypothetical protein